MNAPKSKTASSPERRQAVRAKRILSIQYRLHSGRGTDRRWHLSTTHDMSAVGLSFLSEVSYPVDDVLEMHVVMSGVLDVFKGFARVVRVEKKSSGALFLLGVRFVRRPPSGNKARTRVVRRVSTQRRLVRRPRG